MKKFLALFLAILMIVSAVPVASAVNAYEYLPTIYIRGSGEGLYYPDGTPLVATFEQLSFGGEEGGIDKDVIVETAVNILKPFVLEGMLFNDWDNYGRAVYEEIKPLFPDSGLDENGNPMKGTGVSKDRQALKESLPYSSWEYNHKSKTILITGNKIIHTIQEAEPIGPKKMLDLLIIAPCSREYNCKISK